MTPTSSLAAIPLTPRHHFRVHYHAAVFLLIDHLRRSSTTGDIAELLDRHPFLVGYLDSVTRLLPTEASWSEARTWWPTAIARWEQANPEVGHLPLSAVAAGGRFDFTARMQLVCTGLIEEDSRFGPLLAEVAGRPLRRPTLEVLIALTADMTTTDDGTSPVGGLDEAPAIARRLVAAGAIVVPNPDEGRADWQARLPIELWDVLAGDGDPGCPPWMRHEPRVSLPTLDRVVIPQAVRAATGALPRLIADRSVDVVIVRGARGSDRLDLVRAVAGAAGHGVLRVDAATAPERFADRIGALATALNAVPVVEYDLGPGETVPRCRPRGYEGASVAVMADTGGIALDATDRAVTIEFPLLAGPDRAQRWKAAFDGRVVDDIDEIARCVRLQGSHIEQAAEGALVAAALDGGNVVATRHVRAAAGQLNRQLLDTLASPIEADGGWADLVVGDFTMVKLHELESRCRHREQLIDRLGDTYSPTTGVGVRALFTGASGTGKTLSARVLGAQLGLDVYRVDLAAVIDKYVGETEKNLHRVLSTAEELDVLLLIDEGDSLLGRRTEVRSSNDRFANLETNYLLQRLESYRGVVVVTTNAADNIDPAFQRRMDVVVSFLAPTARQRLDIWLLHLPDNHRIPTAYLEELATRCAMTGGQIRNAVLHAAVQSVDDADAIELRHLEHAVAAEYQKAGATSPFDPSGRRHRISPARAFQELLR